jgi:hypothetical protein
MHKIWICVNEDYIDEFTEEIKELFGDKFKVNNLGNGLIVLETNKLGVFKKAIFRYYLESYLESKQNGKIKWVNYKEDDNLISWLQ